MISMNHCVRVLVGLLFAVTVVGCVTEVRGGTQPKSEEAQLLAQLDLARGYLSQRNWARARAPLSRALELDPRSVEALVLTGYLYQSEDETALAENYYKQALRIDRTDAQALNNYGSFLFAEQRYPEAVEWLQRATEDPDYEQRAQVYENLGLALLETDAEDKALLAFHRSLNLNARQARSSLELASIYYDRGELRRADEFYSAFRGLARQNRRSLCVGFKIASKRGDLDQAASYGLALKNLYSDASECLTE